VSIQKVAKLAGVSISTVSRVINSHPSVAPEAAENVWTAVKQLSFHPTPRGNNGRSHLGASNGKAHGNGRSRTGTIGFIVFGTSGTQTAPAFEKLLRGVSDAATTHAVNLTFNFVSNLSELPRRVMDREVDGLLLHGELPGETVRTKLRQMPCVWLMGNRRRPDWGDQVMPDNSAIGEMAAAYLLARGHQRVVYLGTGQLSWSLGVRALAFKTAADDRGATATIIEAPEEFHRDFWAGDGLPQVGEALAEKVVSMSPATTGLFIAEDRLLPVVHAALVKRGVSIGRGKDVEIISCNNEQPHLVGLSEPPATIDIRTESIGRRGVEQLLWRMQNNGLAERVRTLIEPVLVERKSKEEEKIEG
jgi:LacI family transcriptional regulator